MRKAYFYIFSTLEVKPFLFFFFTLLIIFFVLVACYCQLDYDNTHVAPHNLQDVLNKPLTILQTELYYAQTQ